MTGNGSASARWRELLEARAIPPEIRAAAPDNPYRHEPRRFAAPEQPPDTPSRRAGVALLGDGGTTLDVGCGAGAASLSLLPAATHLTGVDHAEDMLAAFGAECDRRGAGHRTVHGAWPQVAPEAGGADVVVCHHVGYNTPEIGPFVAALHEAARRGVVVELTAEHPTAWLDPLWSRFHGLDRPPAATYQDAVAVMQEVGLRPDVEHWDRPPRDDVRAQAGLACRRLCLPADRLDEVAAAIAELPPRRGGIVTLHWKTR
ncbi:MAG: methyltransferase domain-containing protein [Pseudonocardiaceae bacterium]|nr:methyltransferase domain-containing protein [Pseudonocardiaceae bacterium]